MHITNRFNYSSIGKIVMVCIFGWATQSFILLAVGLALTLLLEKSNYLVIEFFISIITQNTKKNRIYVYQAFKLCLHLLSKNIPESIIPTMNTVWIF